MATWPPLLDDVKADSDVLSDHDDEAITAVLSAAIAYVERVRAGEIQFTIDPESLLPVPDDDLVLGTIRLTQRWVQRGRTPNALMQMGEMGEVRVPSFDADIERLLRVGRFAPMRFA